MKTVAAWRAGVATDPGLERPINEDRVLSDEARGIFLVVDGLGGHAAGEMAAETALHILNEHMTSLTAAGDIEAHIRRAITDANNRIYELAETNKEWHGMACVLTLAVAQDDRVTVGHVGDSRLYLVWNGNLRKITSDHSPVGEQEDHGELTEAEAMQHPRRNEIFRDVGSHPREPWDPQFIETKSFLFRPDAALLLCSDGLTDVLRSAQINSIVARYDGNPSHTARQLVDAANEAGGKDNISVIFVAGPDFQGSESAALQDARPRHAITRMRAEQQQSRPALRATLWLLAGMALGILLWAALERLIPRPAPQPAVPVQVHTPVHITVDPGDPRGILQALTASVAGDTIDVLPGEYLGPIQLKNNVDIIGRVPGQAILRSDPAASSDAGYAIIARDVKSARVAGLRVTGDDAHPLRTGVWITNSSIELDNTEISDASEAGIRIDGSSSPLLLANYIHANAGAGLIIAGQSAPGLEGNWISENGTAPAARRSGVEIESGAKPVLGHNVILRNGRSTFGNIPPAFDKEIRSNNFTDSNAGRPQIRPKAPVASSANQTMR